MLFLLNWNVLCDDTEQPRALHAETQPQPTWLAWHPWGSAPERLGRGFSSSSSCLGGGGE